MGRGDRRSDRPPSHTIYYLSPGKTRKHVARNICCVHMFSQTFSSLAKREYFATREYFAVGNNASYVAKLGDIGESKHMSAGNVSGNTFPRFAKAFSRIPSPPSPPTPPSCSYCNFDTTQTDAQSKNLKSKISCT